jgi:aminomethyltransferase
MGDRKETPLLAVHRELGAKLTEFGGWDMPLQYSGIIAEHNAVRGSCGLFDVSHLGKLLLEGSDAGRALQETLTCDVDSLDTDAASYALVLEDDGGCVDDVFLYRLAAERWLLVPNASNVDAVADMVRRSGGEPLDAWDRWAILALQGPDSFGVFEKVFGRGPALDLRLHRWCDLDFPSGAGLIARTGYTGERGFELYVPSADAPDAFRSLLEAGAAPVGLGARDTLRLEMGYALYGHEIDRNTNPLEAGLGWAVSWGSGFRGEETLRLVKESGPRRKLFGFRATSRGVPRQGYPVKSAAGETIGEVVSGNFSPTLGTGIALAYAPSESVPAPGDEVTIEARGRALEGDIVKSPFVTKDGGSKK